MTKLDQIKILDNKILANNAQYNLDRKNAEISALSGGNLDKYEYLTSKDLEYKPDAVIKAKFEYSPLGKVFNEGLDKNDKKEGLLKRLKNIDGNNEKQFKIPDNQENKGGIKLDTFEEEYFNNLSEKGKEIFCDIVRIHKSINYRKLYFKMSKVNDFDFTDYLSLLDLFKRIYSRDLKLSEVIVKQNKFNALLKRLEKYNTRKNNKAENNKQDVLKNARPFHDGREMMYNVFNEGIFPHVKGVDKGKDKLETISEADEESTTDEDIDPNALKLNWLENKS